MRGLWVAMGAMLALYAATFALGLAFAWPALRALDAAERAVAKGVAE